MIPRKEKLGKDATWSHWKYRIKERLGIDKDMYGLKHTGNIDYLLNNKGKADLKWQQMQNRHSSSAMTDRYNRKLGAYFLEVAGLNFATFD